MTLQEFFTQTLPQIISVASIISAALPEPNPGSIGYVLKQLVNVLAVNFFNAKNTPKNNTTNVIKGFFLAVGIGTLCYHAVESYADTAVTITQPSTRENGSAFDPAKDSSATKLYKKNDDGTLSVTSLPPNTTNTTLPSACVETQWYATVLDKTPPPVGPLESGPSPILTLPIDAVGCAPKKPLIAITGG